MWKGVVTQSRRKVTKRSEKEESGVWLCVRQLGLGKRSEFVKGESSSEEMASGIVVEWVFSVLSRETPPRTCLSRIFFCLEGLTAKYREEFNERECEQLFGDFRSIAANARAESTFAIGGPMPSAFLLTRNAMKGTTGIILPRSNAQAATPARVSATLQDAGGKQTLTKHLYTPISCLKGCDCALVWVLTGNRYEQLLDLYLVVIEKRKSGRHENFKYFCCYTFDEDPGPEKYQGMKTKADGDVGLLPYRTFGSDPLVVSLGINISNYFKAYNFLLAMQEYSYSIPIPG
ncbi:hypothetical protein BDK51DRAFT_30391 [Blyttiomyces helicus]|uniref:Uncharacterized protein n=1 Tax=Blyttiomyces helicus TaxID=388810 RepID=A0A4P9WCW7_9FUNG|nr:hypothetical protein BDK51DRAFT_30391 [Blyttiomyces helicus]|eukprot:RKO90501.1 hypothetical protein BDK51DRAFT_30391 [Blyttiomyces helicus]